MLAKAHQRVDGSRYHYLTWLVRSLTALTEPWRRAVRLLIDGGSEWTQRGTAVRHHGFPPWRRSLFRESHVDQSHVDQMLQVLANRSLVYLHHDCTAWP